MNRNLILITKQSRKIKDYRILNPMEHGDGEKKWENKEEINITYKIM